MFDFEGALYWDAWKSASMSMTKEEAIEATINLRLRICTELLVDCSNPQDEFWEYTYDRCMNPPPRRQDQECEGGADFCDSRSLCCG